MNRGNALTILGVIVIGVITYLLFAGPLFQSKPQKCLITNDAKLCPDGTVVERIPPTCDFAPCPDMELRSLGKTD